MSITCYEYLKKSADVNGNFTAAISFGSKTSMSKLLSDIDAVAAYFNHIGVVKGDSVTVFLPTTIHAFTAFYALNKIGVIANIVHPLTSPEGLLDSINVTKSKALFVLEIPAIFRALYAPIQITFLFLFRLASRLLRRLKQRALRNSRTA